MQSFSAEPARSHCKSHYTTRIHPALTSFADKVCGTLARLVAYVVTLALLAMGGMALWEQLPDLAAMDPSSRDASLNDASLRGAWSLLDRSSRAFAVSQFDPHDKTEAYEIFRHPKGGRRDFRWRGADRRPVAELEIYRPGGELGHAGLSANWLTAETTRNCAAPSNCHGLPRYWFS